MCGRYASFRHAQALADTFEVTEISAAAAAIPPSFNVAPTQPVRIVLARALPETGLQRQLHAARWGLVPPWATDPGVGARLINARAETAAEKRSFAPSVRTRRCVLPADGYYEWQRLPEGGKVPQFIHRSDGEPMALAGLYAFWRDRSLAEDDPARWLLTATVLTRAARPALAEIHDREPVVVTGEALGAWLDPAVTDAEQALGALDGEDPPLQFHAVGTAVGNVANDSEGLIVPVDG